VGATWKARIDSLEQAGEHAFDLVDIGLELSEGWIGQKTQIMSKHREIFQFASRAEGDIKELSQFGFCAPAASFGNIRGNRRGGASHLAGQPVALFCREDPRQSVNHQCERMTLLPDSELSEILHGFDWVPFELFITDN
jgi:hypothetical protein